MDVTPLPRHPGFEAWSVADYLAVLWPDRSRRAILDLLAHGRIRSGGRPVGASRKVGEIQDLHYHGSPADLPSMLAGEGGGHPGIEILHEDGRLIVLSKPSGIPVVPDRGHSTGSVLGFLIRRELASRAGAAPGEFSRYRIVHRIDRLTSGLVIVARTPEAERRLSADFEARRVGKEYAALLRGEVLPGRITVHCPVAPGRKGKMRAAALGSGGKAGRDATTVFDVAERFRGYTLVRAKPLTGRTHQIRVHAWAAGHPLAIDPLYGPVAGRPIGALSGLPPERLTLHALLYSLPGDWDEPRTFECPLPADLRMAFESLRQEAP